MQLFDMTKPVSGKAAIRIDTPVARVFDFVGDRLFDNYPKWAVEVSEFTPLSGHSVFVGAQAQQIRMEYGQKVESIFEVSEFVPPLKITLSGVGQPFRNTYRFNALVDIDCTELEFCFELLELELFMRPFEKLIRMAIEEGAENTVANISALIIKEFPNH